MGAKGGCSVPLARGRGFRPRSSSNDHRARALARRHSRDLYIMAVLVGLFLGLFQGLRHAFEPDHVLALSTMIADTRTLGARIAYAAAWGLGHATTLLAVGAALMLGRSQLPPRMDQRSASPWL
jgi:high-affinity nickel permease